MVDMLALAVALVALWAILEKSVPTGVLGSLGLALIGCSALVAVDDSSFADVQRLEAIVSALLLGFLFVVAHIVLLVWRGSTGRATRRRRASDYVPFDAEDTQPMERA